VCARVTRVHSCLIVRACRTGRELDAAAVLPDLLAAFQQRGWRVSDEATPSTRLLESMPLLPLRAAEPAFRHAVFQHVVRREPLAGPFQPTPPLPTPVLLIAASVAHVADCYAALGMAVPWRVVDSVAFSVALLHTVGPGWWLRVWMLKCRPRAQWPKPVVVDFGLLAEELVRAHEVATLPGSLPLLDFCAKASAGRHPPRRSQAHPLRNARAGTSCLPAHLGHRQHAGSACGQRGALPVRARHRARDAAVRCL
jgi:hypothetical protein